MFSRTVAFNLHIYSEYRRYLIISKCSTILFSLRLRNEHMVASFPISKVILGVRLGLFLILLPYNKGWSTYVDQPFLPQSDRQQCNVMWILWRKKHGIPYVHYKVIDFNEYKNNADEKLWTDQQNSVPASSS